MSLVSKLLSCPLFTGVNDLPVALGPQDLRLVRVSTGQNVIDQNDDAGDVYFPLSGHLLALHLDAEGRELIFTRLSNRDYFGELSAIDHRPRSLSVYAKSDAQLLILKQRAFLDLIDQLPLIQNRVLNDLVARIRVLTERNYQLTSQNVPDRVKTYLAHLALEAGAFIPNGRLKNAPTHAEIAGTIGANREAVSRCISDLKRAGVLDAGRQRMVILQPDALLTDT